MWSINTLSVKLQHNPIIEARTFLAISYYKDLDDNFLMQCTTIPWKPLPIRTRRYKKHARNGFENRIKHGRENLSWQKGNLTLHAGGVWSTVECDPSFRNSCKLMILHRRIQQQTVYSALRCLSYPAFSLTHRCCALENSIRARCL